MTASKDYGPDQITDELGLLLYLCDPEAFERTMGRKPTQFDFLCRAYEAYLHIMSCNFNRVKFHSLCAERGLPLADPDDDPSGVIVGYFGRFFLRSADIPDHCDFDSDAQLHCTLLRHGRFASMSYETFREFVRDLGNDLQAVTSQAIIHLRTAQHMAQRSRKTGGRQSRMDYVAPLTRDGRDRFDEIGN